MKTLVFAALFASLVLMDSVQLLPVSDHHSAARQIDSPVRQKIKERIDSVAKTASVVGSGVFNFVGVTADRFKNASEIISRPIVTFAEHAADDVKYLVNRTNIEMINRLKEYESMHESATDMPGNETELVVDAVTDSVSEETESAPKSESEKNEDEDEKENDDDDEENAIKPLPTSDRDVRVLDALEVGLDEIPIENEMTLHLGDEDDVQHVRRTAEDMSKGCHCKICKCKHNCTCKHCMKQSNDTLEVEDIGNSPTTSDGLLATTSVTESELDTAASVDVTTHNPSLRTVNLAEFGVIPTNETSSEPSVSGEVSVVSATDVADSRDETGKTVNDGFPFKLEVNPTPPPVDMFATPEPYIYYPYEDDVIDISKEMAKIPGDFPLNLMNDYVLPDLKLVSVYGPEVPGYAPGFMPDPSSGFVSDTMMTSQPKSLPFMPTFMKRKPSA